jgi:GTPase Era involved in 16S rRNA processing
MPSARLRDIVAGKDGARVARINTRVGAELAHMTRRYVDLSVSVRVPHRRH